MSQESSSGNAVWCKPWITGFLERMKYTAPITLLVVIVYNSVAVILYGHTVGNPVGMLMAWVILTVLIGGLRSEDTEYPPKV